MILGPADANHFRVKVGRYGDRWYADPLPGDDIAPATEDAWPSFSIVKGASGKDWTFVGLKRVAHATTSELERLPGLPVEQRYDTCKSINDHGLKVAAGRGTILHWWGEDMLHGRPPRDVTPLDLTAARIPAESLTHAKRYLPAFRDFFQVYQPELVAAEYVAIHRDLNGVGYGCTPDGLWVIEGDLFAFDYKSRTEDGDHAAYPEEGGQIAAGTHAQYMIVEGEHGAERRPLPKVKAGMVVSLKPDGVRIYPVDLDKAFEHYTAMHGWWCARRDEREPIGRPWPVKKIAAPPLVSSAGEDYVALSTSPATLRSDLITRAKAIVEAGHGLRLAYVWPDRVPGFKTAHPHNAGELEAIRQAIHEVEVEQDMPFTSPDDMTLPTPQRHLTIARGPDKSGGPLTVRESGPAPAPTDDLVSDDDWNTLKAAAAALPAADQFRLQTWLGNQSCRTERRAAIAWALILCCEAGLSDDDIRDLCGCIQDRVHPADTPIGSIVGAFTLAEAKALTEMADTRPTTNTQGT